MNFIDAVFLIDITKMQIAIKLIMNADEMYYIEIRRCVK